MTYKPTSLATLIGLKNNQIFLPHIQRPFVWEHDQILRFLDSLMKNYPIQTFLFWKTRDAIKARKFMDDIVEDPDLSIYYDKNVSEQGREKIFVLDGQQRLQALFSAFSGTFFGKDLYVDIVSGDSEIENGISYKFELHNNSCSLPLFKIKSLYDDRRNAEEIADEINHKLSQVLTESPPESSQREKRVRRNISQLVSILREDKHLWIEELDGVASNAYPYSTVLNIFIRVNSGGTKLDAADLMFAVMKESWAEIEQNLELVVANLNKSGRLNFDKNVVLKSLTSASGKGVTLDPDLFTGSAGDANLQLLENNWSQADRAFSQLRDFIYRDLKVYSDKVIRSYNALIPIFEYFFLNPSPCPKDILLLKSYYYSSQLFNWYSARTDQLLDAIHNMLKTHLTDFPLSEIRAYFQKQNKEVNLSIQHLDDNRLRFIILNLMYVENFGTSPFDVAYKGNEPHIDHIYPRSKLTAFPTNEVNHIGNYRYIGANENLRKRAESPSSYFLGLKTSGVNIERHLLVTEYSNDPNRLVDTNYTDFRTKRVQSIFDICSKIVNVQP